jgi:hypothetical protein
MEASPSGSAGSLVEQSLRLLASNQPIEGSRDKGVSGAQRVDSFNRKGRDLELALRP